MGLFAKTDKTEVGLDRRTALLGIPALVPGVTMEREEDGRLMVIVPIKQKPGFWSHFRTMASTHCVRLDEIGAFVMEKINGERTVQEIVEAFASKYRVNKREAELSMADFLKSLVKRNIIAIGIR